MSKILSAIASAFYGVFKSTILEAWKAAKRDALAEIQEELPADDQLAEARRKLALADKK